MEGIKVHSQSGEPEKKKRVRIKPAGWLTIAVLAALFLALLSLGAQRIYWAARGIEALPSVPVPTYTPTPAPVLPTPTPQGWSRAWDPVTKQEYLVPPPEEEAQIREAFNAVLGCVVVKDADDAALKAYRRPDPHPYALEHVAKWASNRVAVEIRDLAPESPVRCTEHNTCTMAQAVTAFHGYVVFAEDQCPEGYRPAPCVVRTPFAVTDAPNGRAFIATLVKEGSRWLVARWKAAFLPPVPSP